MTITSKNIIHHILSGKKIRIINTDKKIQYVMSLKNDYEYGFKELIEVADTNVHNGFLGMVDKISGIDPKFSEIRKAETDQTVDFVLFRSSIQTILKDTKHGETIISI